MTKETFSRYFLERINVLTDEITRLREVIKNISEGNSYDESWMENVHSEELYEEKMARAYTSRMIEKLFELKYCIGNWNYNDWMKDFRKYSEEVMNIAWWPSDGENKIINMINLMIDDVYEFAISWYEMDNRKYKYLSNGLKYIPEKCPWTGAEELLGERLEDLLDKLPDPDILSTQLQLYPSCKYRNPDHLLKDEIYDHTCNTCKEQYICKLEYQERLKSKETEVK